MLLWKNHLLRKRNISTFLIEVLVPVAFTFILVSIANTVKVKHVHCSAPSLYHNSPHIYPVPMIFILAPR